MPENTIAEEGEDKIFRCEAKGDPPPTILWRRERGHMPDGRCVFAHSFKGKQLYGLSHVFTVFLSLRTHILPEKSLQLTSLRVEDEGNYLCRAENEVGFVETTFTLTVHCECKTSQVLSIFFEIYHVLDNDLLFGQQRSRRLW